MSGRNQIIRVTTSGQLPGRAAGGKVRLWPTLAAAARQCWKASPSLLIGAMALNLVSGVLPVATALLTKHLLDALIASPSRVEPLVVAGIVGCGAGLIAAQQLGVYLDQQLRRKIATSVQEDLFTKLNSFVGLRPFEDPRMHDELSVAQQSGVSAPQHLAGAAVRVARSLVQLAGFAAAVWMLWPPILALVVLAALPALLAESRLARAGAQLIRSLAPLQRRKFFYETMLTDAAIAKELRLFGATGFLHAKMLAALHLTNRAESALDWRTTRVRTLLGLLGSVVGAAGLIVAATRVSQGALTVGDLVLLLAALSGVQGCLLSLVSDGTQSYAALLTYGAYRGLLDAHVDLPAGPLPAPALREGIEFRDVWFRYDEEGPWILRGVTFTIPSGQCLGLVGENGAGKSTLVKLLCRFYDPQRGQILWDGMDLRDLDPVSLRARLGAVFQDFVHYDLSARENIGIGRLQVIDDGPRVRDAARLAGADDFLAALPNGYDSLLSRIFFDDEETSSGTGVALSGGQWQRVALARSLLHDDADLLILDEPSSGLDANAEYSIHRTLRAHREGRTSLLISHRLSAIKEADLIVVLGEGEVIERGSHGHLITSEGVYAQMFHRQAEGYLERTAA